MSAKVIKRLKKRISKIRRGNLSYYIQENVIQGSGDLKMILNPLPDVEPIKSIKPFAINDLNLNDVTPKTLKEKFGPPSNILKNDHNIEKHKIYFYRDRVGYYKLLLQFHFINNEFLFASTRLSVPKGLTIERKREIVRQALIKYTGARSNKQVKSLDLKLVDENNNIMFVHDYVSFYLNYLVDNETRRRLIVELFETTDEKQEEETSKTGIEKYI